MRNQDHRGRGQPPMRPRQGRGRGATAWGREDGGDDATEAGGGNLHRGRGATAWGREDGGNKGRRGQTHEESESMPGAEKMGATKAGGGKLTKNPSQCLGPGRWWRHRPAGANSGRIRVNASESKSLRSKINPCGREIGYHDGRWVDKLLRFPSTWLLMFK